MGETASRFANAAQLVVRPVRGEERGRWRAMMNTHHYLGFRPMVGESLWYVAMAEERWVALLGWAAAALARRLGPTHRRAVASNLSPQQTISPETRYLLTPTLIDPSKVGLSDKEGKPLRVPPGCQS